MPESLLDALNEAFDGPTEETTDEELEGSGEESAEGEEPAAGGEETSNEETTGGDEPAADEEGEESAAKKAEAKADDKPTAKTPEQLAAEGQPKEKDHVNDPIPKWAKKETRERIESLVGTVRTLSGRAEKAEAEHKELMSYIEATGATPKQYSDALGYLGLVNSGDPVKMEQALTIMQGEVAALAKLLGKPVAGVDMLESHPDLQEEVAEGTLSAQRAQEIAAARERSRVTTQASQRHNQTVQQERQWQADVANGKAALTQLEATLKTDPQYAAKRAILVPALQSSFAKLHPSEWAAAFESAYKNLKIPMAAPRAKIPANQPLRAKTPAQGGNGEAARAPKSMLDAINNAFGA